MAAQDQGLQFYHMNLFYITYLIYPPSPGLHETLGKNTAWYHYTYIPLIRRVRGPHGKLWTKFFLPFMAQAQNVQAMKIRKEKTRIHNLPDSPSKQG